MLSRNRNGKGVHRGERLVNARSRFWKFLDLTPVEAVKPDIVLEVAFTSIQPNTRHPSGLALRFPRNQSNPARQGRRFHRHASIRSGSRRTTREFAG
jgi:ATP-dependent DNA ligase